MSGKKNKKNQMDHLWLEKGEDREEARGAGPKQATYGPDVLGGVPHSPR